MKTYLFCQLPSTREGHCGGVDDSWTYIGFGPAFDELKISGSLEVAHQSMKTDG
jgi:hypothetical protein